jgi:hypothetical protein
MIGVETGLVRSTERGSAATVRLVIGASGRHGVCNLPLPFRIADLPEN